MNYLEEISFDEFAIKFGLLYKRWTTYIQVLQHIQYVKHRQSQRRVTRTFSLVINRDRWWLFCFLVHYCLYRLIRRQFQTDPGICYFHQTDQLAFKNSSVQIKVDSSTDHTCFLYPVESSIANTSPNTGMRSYAFYRSRSLNRASELLSHYLLKGWCESDVESINSKEQLMDSPEPKAQVIRLLFVSLV